MQHKAKVLFHSSIKIDDIFIDPFKITSNDKAKIILITHPHYDHYSLEDIEKVMTRDTLFIAPKEGKEDLEKHFKNYVIEAIIGQDIVLPDLKIKVIPSYNVNKNFHKKEYNWVGYILEYENIKYAILGDCDENVDNRKVVCDVLLLPIGGYYTMDGIEGALLTKKIRPKLVIPTHYNAIVGSKENEKEFIDNLNGEVPYEIMIF